MNASAIPLCVDLDGTLICSDLLLESLLLLIKRNPLYLFLVPWWLLHGKAALKAEIAKRISLNPAALPYNEAFFIWISAQKSIGRPLWLCTASNHRLAKKIATHLGIFDGVISSSDTENISGKNKAKKLVERFGSRRFDYCGNNQIDLEIWRVSQGAIMVNATPELEKQAKSYTKILFSFPKKSRILRAAMKALRPHQWVKNMLLFIPLAAAHQLNNIDLALNAGIAFVAFGLCASSVYLLNDMLDLEVDRQHQRKKYRPFAAGDLSLLFGFTLVPILFAAAIVLALQLPHNFLLVLLCYYALTLAYSFVLKRIELLDTIALAGLYTIRIVAGAAAVDVPLSFWLLLFSIFLFLSLALVKRYAELDSMLRQGKLKAAGRGYLVEDLTILDSMGAASGYLCVIILALYINSPDVEVLYSHPKIIWFLCVLLLYWISRVWLRAHRGTMHDDPLVFALKDPVSLVVAALSAATVIAAA
ncbi:MAG TPA: UbiA family prenyltransferase [Burkholderiaceae bacterium]|jgi:4-hydroxybenzoate polyprenyltransferase